MVTDPREHICKPGSRVNVIELGSDDEAVDGSSTLAAAVRARKQPRLASNRDATQRARRRCWSGKSGHFPGTG